jgi:hypothetical protein
MTRGLQLGARSHSAFERAVLAGFEVFRQLGVLESTSSTSAPMKDPDVPSAQVPAACERTLIGMIGRCSAAAR